jgi:hypothetical protein
MNLLKKRKHLFISLSTFAIGFALLITKSNNYWIGVLSSALLLFSVGYFGMTVMVDFLAKIFSKGK